jgi:hypothetical protein
LRAPADANLIDNKNRGWSENGMGDANDRVPGALIQLRGQLMAPAGGHAVPVINLTPAHAVCLTIQQTILGRADEVLV